MLCRFLLSLLRVYQFFARDIFYYIEGVIRVKEECFIEVIIIVITRRIMF